MEERINLSLRDIPEAWYNVLADLPKPLPAPLQRAVRLEKALKTRTRIWFKNESQSPPGSHKLITAIPQAYYKKQAGMKRLTTETGAGQWGSSIAYACEVFGLEVKKQLELAGEKADMLVFEAARLFALSEGIVPAPETSHAICAVVQEARKNEDKSIVFNLSGHGHFDLTAYDAFLDGKLEDYEHPEHMIEEALKDLPEV